MTVLDLTALTLTAGEHTPGSDKMCLLEAVSYIAGERWSDHPVCVSPVLGMYGRRLNDTLSNETRQRLVPFISRLLNTAGDGLDGRRSYLALDWLTPHVSTNLAPTRAISDRTGGPSFGCF